MNTLERDLHPADEERRLRDELEVARKNKDRNKQKVIENKLVKLYVSQAEYFKMSDKPDSHIAIKYLQKAVRIQPDHPVANYRLGFIHYREKSYAKAILYLERALDGTETEGLNDTQNLLANMFLVNCGIRIARESISEIHSIEENLYSDLEKDRIEKYRREILVLDEYLFERMFYKKILDGHESRINEDEFGTYQPMGKQLILRISDHGRELVFPDTKKVNLNPVSFYIFYALLTAKEFLTYRDLKRKIIAWSELEVTEDNIRQIISRYSRNIPLWKAYFQSTNILSVETNRQVVAYKLAEKFSCCILCRGDEVLPGEY
jgi:tetratricopeptide (TPR) repeat protein